jgi:hypothetical protein
MKRCAKIFAVVFLIFVSVASVIKLCFCFWSGLLDPHGSDEVDIWLEQNNLVQFKDLFIGRGESLRKLTLPRWRYLEERRVHDVVNGRQLEVKLAKIGR